MNEYIYPRSVDTPAGGGWTTVISAIVGGVVGYFAGRNNNCGNWNNCGNGCGNGGQTAFQQGEYTGENRAGINFIAQEVNKSNNAIVALASEMNQSRIADLVAKNQALETQLLIKGATDGIACQVAQVNRTLDAATTGVGFTSYPGCKKGCF
jgi:hypothetical protein